MKENDLRQIVNPLLAWYRDNARPLPWRQNRNPYCIWVSEIMLQQTRVETVIPYYERFMERYPDIKSLAEAEEEQLLKLWEGLGYYSRVRNLQRAARMICTDYQGHFPREYEAILKLPGIGAYTAGAVSSIAFEKAEPAVDGNVLRVVTRLTENSRDIQDVKFRKQVTEALRVVYPVVERGNFTQSLMELGAVVCVPNGAPKCNACPIHTLCGAYQNNTQQLYPVKKKKAARKIEEKTVLILECNGCIALNRRDKNGLLSGMWELPNLEGRRSAADIEGWLGQQGITVEKLTLMPEKKHIFTHVEWHMKCFAVLCGFAAEGNGFTWVEQERLEQEIALPTAFKKVL